MATANISDVSGYHMVGIVGLSVASPANLAISSFWPNTANGKITGIAASIRKITSGSATYNNLFTIDVLYEKDL